MAIDRQKLIKIIQSSWRSWVRRINSEQEQFEKNLDERRRNGEIWEVEYDIEKKGRAHIYSERRAVAREAYIVDLSIIKRADSREDIHYLSIPHHVPRPKYF